MNNVEAMFGCLAKFYGWSYNTIAEMTPAQCAGALIAASEDSEAADNIDTGKPGLDGNLHFSTRDRWILWKQTRGIK